MTSLKRQQRGMTLIGWIITLVLIGFVALITLRLVPVYMESFTVGSILDNIESDGALAGDSPGEIREAFKKRLTLNDVDSVGADDLEIEQVAGGMELVVQYEARVKLIGNLDAVASFRKEAVLRN